MTAAPAPLVPADVDLRGYEFMPLFGDRMFTSETWIGASAEEKLAAIRLWWRSFAHELPAGSLPDNEKMLAEYAGLGSVPKAWRKVKPQAMRGFVLCSDGRWYHRFLAGVVIDLWSQRQTARAKGLLGASKRWPKSRDSSGNAPAITNHSPGNAPATENNSCGNATAIKNGSSGNATATKNDSKGKESKEKKDLDLGVNNTSPTRGNGHGEGPEPLNFFSDSRAKSTASDVDANRETARKLVTGELTVGGRKP